MVTNLCLVCCPEVYRLIGMSWIDQRRRLFSLLFQIARRWLLRALGSEDVMSSSSSCRGIAAVFLGFLLTAQYLLLPGTFNHPNKPLTNSFASVLVVVQFLFVLMSCPMSNYSRIAPPGSAQCYGPRTERIIRPSQLGVGRWRQSGSVESIGRGQSALSIGDHLSAASPEVSFTCNPMQLL